ncbi:MAG: D,D-dipeptide ABC transporter permease, partial [Firmicutes bacterium]|nr:D,D-dipeptide ABC transporter permease [Bacillota bacterium]
MLFSKKILQAKLKELKETFYLLNRNLLTRVALIVLAILILTAIFAPLLAPYPEDAGTATHPTNSLAPMSAEHIMGTDELGRDILSKIIYGTRISLSTAVITIIFALSIGLTLGAVA